MASLNPDLLKILVCPKCKSPVKAETDRILCTKADCGLVYPVRDGIPIMLIDQATVPARTSR